MLCLKKCLFERAELDMTTIKEIAALAGVSRGTVDRVLNNRGSVNPQTQERILEIIKKLNYQPNKAALSLAAQKKKIVIGVLLSGKNNENPFFEDVLEGVRYQQEKLSGYGCTVIIRRSALNMNAQLAAIDALEASGIHGLVISPYNFPQISDRIDALYAKGIPTITTNTDLPGSKRIAYIGSDYYEAGCTAAGLMGLITGARAKVGIVTGSPMILCHSERLSGFLHTVQERYPQIEILEIRANEDNEVKSYRAVRQLLQKYPEMNALYFGAAGVQGGCRAVIEQNRTGSLKIITYDTVASTRRLVLDGVISATIGQQPFLQGSRPVKLLFDYLSLGTPPKDTLQYTETSIMIRENIQTGTQRHG